MFEIFNINNKPSDLFSDFSMDFEQILRQIQEITNNVPLIILGSGASAPYNLPTMWNLGEHLKTSISFHETSDQDQFDEFKQLLENGLDLETALLNLHLKANVLSKIVEETWKLMNTKDLEAYEFFLKNMSKVPLAYLVQYLVKTSKRRLSIITTNYDRLAEYSASIANAFTCTGFSTNLIGHFSSNIYKNGSSQFNGYDGIVNIWKVHGSLDWFKTNNNIDIHLPLRSKIPDNYKPSIVTPGLSKYSETHLEPYRTILSQADNEIENANGYLCIGYGFNDQHVHPKLISQINKNKPIIVITKELTPNTKKAIIESNCKNYFLFEQSNENDTRIFTPFLSGEEIIQNKDIWNLDGFLNLIKPINK